MFKKNVWIVGLLTALAIMFTGCVDPIVEDNSGVVVTVVDLQEIIKDVPVQVLNETRWNEIFDDTPFKMCGESNGKFEIIEVGGKKALKVSQMTANWGVGFDARSATNPDQKVKGINFKAGDVITIKGSTDLADGFTMNTKGENGMGKIDNWSATGDFSATVTVTTAAAAEIKANSAKGSLRLHGAGDSGPGRIGTIIIEEFKVDGKRGSGDVESALNYNIDGAGEYMKPADSADVYYLDLGTAVYSQLNPNKFPVAKISTKNMTVVYNTNTQGVFVPFTPELKRIILTAKAYGRNVAINVDGSFDNYYSINQVRIGFANDGGGDWNVTDLPVYNITHNTTPQFGVNRALTWGGNYTVAKANGLIIQARPGAIVKNPTTGVDSWSGGNDVGPFSSDGSADRSKIVTYKLTVKSIKIVISGTGSAPTAISSLAFTLPAPRAGATAVKTITGGTNFTGAVTWNPALVDGKFERAQVYTASIAIAFDPGYGAAAAPTFNITCPPAANITTGVWNVATTTATVAFPRTQGFPELAPGVVFKLSDLLKTGNNLSGKDLQAPLENAGATTKYAKADGTTTSGDAAGVVVTGIKSNWHGVTIKLSKVDVGIDTALYKVNIQVKGKILSVLATGDTDKVKLFGANYPPQTQIAISATDLGVDDTFDINGDLGADFLTAGNGDVRIGTNQYPDPAKITSFIVTEIIITNNGLR